MGKKDVLIQAAKVAVFEAVGVAVMFAVYLLLGKFTAGVLAGGIAGWLCAVLYFFMLSVSVSNTMDAAAEGRREPKTAGMLVGDGSAVRLLAVAAVLIVLIKTGLCEPLPAIIPLLFIRPAIMLLEFFGERRDKGERT